MTILIYENKPFVEGSRKPEDREIKKPSLRVIKCKMPNNTN